MRYNLALCALTLLPAVTQAGSSDPNLVKTDGRVVVKRSGCVNEGGSVVVEKRYFICAGGKYEGYITAGPVTDPPDDTPLVDGIDPSSVIASTDFSGRPGVVATAGIIRDSSGGSPSFVVVHRKPDDARSYLVVDVTKFDFSEQVSNSLQTAANGSLRIVQEGDQGRDKWSRVYTVSYRDGSYVLSGFTASAYDSQAHSVLERCDYNFLTGTGVNGSASVSFPKRFVRVADPSENLIERLVNAGCSANLN